jgi:signal transduction histidine kinase
MSELIEDLLEISRVERKELQREPVDIYQVCRRVGDLLAKSDPDRNVEFTVEHGLVAEGDARLIEILVENLLGNAWKFTTRTTLPRVECGSLQKDGQTTFYVKDNGAGFDEAHAQRLFTPFQRLHSSVEFPGTGIGLATVSRIVDRHGGRVWAQGQVDRGATVYWTLPAPTRRSHIHDDAKKDHSPR